MKLQNLFHLNYGLQIRQVESSLLQRVRNTAREGRKTRITDLLIAEM